MAQVTKTQLLDSWNKLFLENNWLDGWESSSECNVFCCPGNPPSWDALSRAKQILWLMNKDIHVNKLKKSMVSSKDL